MAISIPGDKSCSAVWWLYKDEPRPGSTRSVHLASPAPALRCCIPVSTSPYHLNPRMPLITRPKRLLDAIIDTFTQFQGSNTLRCLVFTLSRDELTKTARWYDGVVLLAAPRCGNGMITLTLTRRCPLEKWYPHWLYFPATSDRLSHSDRSRAQARNVSLLWGRGVYELSRTILLCMGV